MIRGSDQSAGKKMPDGERLNELNVFSFLNRSRDVIVKATI